MRNTLIKVGLVSALATALIAAVQRSAPAATWHIQGQDDSGNSCSYAGYYGWLNHRWEDYSCRKDPANPVWWLIVFY